LEELQQQLANLAAESAGLVLPKEAAVPLLEAGLDSIGAVELRCEK
jgi:aryl carrier-like protein